MTATALKSLSDYELADLLLRLIDTAEKGSAASGNWLHSSFNRIDVGRGGSDPSGTGGGLAALGLDKDSTPEERREAAARIRKMETERGDSDVRAIQSFNVREQDKRTYQIAMAMKTPEARAMLERSGMTREQALAAIDKAREEQQQQQPTKYEHMENGVYTPERQALHNEIIAEALEGKTPPPEGEQPTVLITGGYPGAGKSSMLNNEEYAGRLDNFVWLDSDEFKGKLGAADGLKKMGVEAQAYHPESKDVMARVGQQALARGLNVVIDGTMKSNINALAEKYKAAGYRVEVAFADLPMEKSMTRAIGRYLGGGRFVDPAYIASHNHKNLRSLDAVKAVADVWRHWDTDVPFGENARLVGGG